MSDAFPQQNPHYSPEGQLLLARKYMLEMMSRELQPPADMLKINTNFVKSLIIDLNNFVVELKSLRGSSNARKFVRNVGRVHEIIRDYALAKLYTALRKLEEGDIEEYFRYLFRCSDDLEDALKEFLI